MRPRNRAREKRVGSHVRAGGCTPGASIHYPSRLTRGRPCGAGALRRLAARARAAATWQDEHPVLLIRLSIRLSYLADRSLMPSLALILH